MGIEAALKKSNLFKNWKESDLEKVSALAKMRDLGNGEMLFAEKQIPTSFFVIEQGTVAIRKSGGGDDHNVVNLGSGSHFGELGLLGADVRTATAEAVESTKIHELPYKEFTDFLLANPTCGLLFYKTIAESLASRIRKTTEDLAGIKSLRLRHA